MITGVLLLAGLRTPPPRAIRAPLRVLAGVSLSHSGLEQGCFVGTRFS